MNSKPTPTKREVPWWLKTVNIILLFPNIFWPLLFFNAGDMLESSLEYKWIKFLAMLLYPGFLVANYILSSRWYKRDQKVLSYGISAVTGILVCIAMYKFFIPIFW